MCGTEHSLKKNQKQPKTPNKQTQKPKLKEKLKVVNLGFLCEAFTASSILSMRDKETQSQSS